MSLTLEAPRRVGATPTPLPVIVIGGGPVGLAAAAHLLERGLQPIVLEAGGAPAAAVRAWGHVRLFSPWAYLVDEAAARLLAGSGWRAPAADALPTGAELVRDYLDPLAEVLGTRVRTGHRVVAISRLGADRTRTEGRGDAPFVVRVEHDGVTTDVLADAVVDASGTTATPNSVLASGLPVADPAAAARIGAPLPDVLGADRARFVDRHTLVVGAGHSAAGTLLALVALADRHPRTRVSWAIRSEVAHRLTGGGGDGLPARGDLGARVHALVAAGRIRLVHRFEIDEVVVSPDGALRVDGRRAGLPHTERVDEVVAATGFRPDLGPLRELRIAVDDVVEAPVRLAPLIDPNVHSCGTVAPHGISELAHPEPRFAIVGMKSYGRAPTFLLRTGYEQVRSVVAHLAGDDAAARDVRLVLPETGVCRTSIPDAGAPTATGACCTRESASACC